MQAPLPIYSGGNVDGSMRRAAELCQGWLPAKIGPAKIAEGREKIGGYARAVGATRHDHHRAAVGGVPGRHRRQARETFLNSSFDLFRTSLATTMTKGVDLDAYLDINLVGTPDQVCEKVAALAAAGCEHLPRCSSWATPLTRCASRSACSPATSCRP